MNLLDFQVHKLHQFGALLISPSAICSLPQLIVAGAVAFAFLAWRQHRRRGAVRWGAVWRALASPRRWFNASTRADIFYFLVNTFAVGGLIGWGLFSGLSVSTLTQRGLHAAFGSPAPTAAPDLAVRAVMTLVVFVAYEFGYWVDHWCKHRIPALWAVHKTHHTAETLTPLTIFRVHPLDTLIFVDVIALTTGAAHGLITWAAGRSVDMFQIDGANVLTVICLFTVAQLQHSQVWIPIRGPAGRLLFSPAHHQIHHSVDPAHHNRNYGSYLAVFDWMFGTLVIPQAAPPRLRYGVDDGEPAPHRVMTLLITPIVAAAQALLPARGPRGAPVPADSGA